MIPLGLYRAPFVAANNMPYVYTNCQAETRLYAGDRVYLLSREEPVFSDI